MMDNDSGESDCTAGGVKPGSYCPYTPGKDSELHFYCPYSPAGVPQRPYCPHATKDSGPLPGLSPPFPLRPGMYDLNKRQSDPPRIPPQLCPRFPEPREPLAEFAQTPALKKIQGFYDFKPSASHIVLEIKSCPDLDISTASVNNKDLGVVYSEIAPSVVSVCAFHGVERKWECSGLVIHWSSADNEATILTCTKVLFNPKYTDYELYLIVRMADGTMLLGKEDHVDFYHNLLTLKVKSKVELEVLDLRSRQADIVDGMEVISLGRSFHTSSLYDSIGNLYEEHPNFGCDELLRSTCGIRAICEGGPLVTSMGYVVGINFFGHHPCAHPLPTPIILSCLEMWKSFSTVLRPWFGIKVIDLNQLSKEVSNQVRKLFNISTQESNVFVKEVYKGSVAHKNNVRPYDSVATLNGIRIESFKQYYQLLSEASRAATSCDSSQRLIAVINPFDCGTDDKSIEAEYISVDDERLYDCWPEAKLDEWKSFKYGPLNLKSLLDMR